MKKPRILFIDDDVVVLNCLKRVLSQHKNKWNMDFLNSVDKALNQLKVKHYDMVISDLKMPEKSGFDLLKILQKDEQTKYLPVLLLTGFEDSNLKQKAREQGAFDLLPKPVEIEDLILRICSVLRLKEYQDKLVESNNILKEQLLHKQKLELIGRLAMGAFHDLNNMLTIISGYSQMFSLEPEFVEKNMYQITDTCCEASEFTKEILEFARSEKEDKALNFLGEIIDKGVSLLRRCIPKQIEIGWTRPSGIPQIRVSLNQMVQLLMDLCLNITNAVTECRQINISLDEVKISRRSKVKKDDVIPSGRYQRLVISDSDLHQIDKIFQRSSVLTSSPKWNRDNPQINLRIAGMIIKKHEGYLRAAKPRAGGIYIFVYLPEKT